MSKFEEEPQLNAEQIPESRWNDIVYGSYLVEQNPAIYDAERQVDALITPAPENNVYYGKFAELAEKDDMASQAREQIENLPKGA